MEDLIKIRNSFQEGKEEIFKDRKLLNHPYKFSLSYSLLVEEFIITVLQGQKVNYALLSAGSFSRRELSPFSDIDIMIIIPEDQNVDEEIQTGIKKLWDCGIEVSHTVRKFEDIERFLEEDLHAFTQFFETRFILGNEPLYHRWNKKLMDSVSDDVLPRLVNQYYEEQEQRHNKYGNSPKVLEPNIKLSAGGLRDLHLVEWIFALHQRVIFIDQSETSQTEIFLNYLKDNEVLGAKAVNRLKDSYGLILKFRNALHLISSHKTDRLEFSKQEEIAKLLEFQGEDWRDLMKEYFHAANILNRFSKTMLKKFEEIFNPPTSPRLEIDLDEDFYRKGNRISIRNAHKLSISEMMRVYYYRGLYNCTFDQQLRSLIIESVIELEDNKTREVSPSVFFREILNLQQNVGKTLSAMHEVGLLNAFMSEFNDLSGFFQPGVYHTYTADEHSLIALQNAEALEHKNNELGVIFNNLHKKDLLFLSILLHDIAKPISVSGHEIIGSDMTNSIMEMLGYEADEIDFVQFLVRHHLTMEQVAFRRNLNDPHTLDSFSSIFPKRTWLNYLYILTYADLSAVNPAVWTQWKHDLLFELYHKTKQILNERITGEELLYAAAEESFFEGDDQLKDHIRSINDFGYQQHFTQDEINAHIIEIGRDLKISVLFGKSNGFTNITVITNDIDSLLARLTGALSINDLNIHGARIFTKKDGTVIDSFNVTDFRTGKPIDESRFKKIEKDLALSIDNELYIDREFNKVRTKWWRLEKKIFSLKPKIKIEFEKHAKYTIIDVYAPDKLGLLYQVTSKLHELGLTIILAKIATKADDVVDAFYVLDKSGSKVPEDNYELIRVELTQSIQEIL